MTPLEVWPGLLVPRHPGHGSVSHPHGKLAWPKQRRWWRVRLPTQPETIL